MTNAQAGQTLVFMDDTAPGITRRRFRNSWRYFDPQGHRITDAQEIARLNAIALPPAYRDAWYAPLAHAHILACGWDAKGRKQYRYHPDFRAERDSRKFDHCADFARALPLIRARVAQDMAKRGACMERALACVVRLLDTGGIRVGNQAYARQNKSFGATTLRMRHADVRGGSLHLRFRAKSGQMRDMTVSDKGLIRFVKAMQHLPGQSLFQYRDDDGHPVAVTSHDVNAYIRETMGQDFSAKDFRTWVASALAFAMMHDAAADLSMKDIMAHVSASLGNTPAIARKSYVHPALIAAAGGDQTALRALRLPRAARWLDRHERALIAYLDDQPSAAQWLSQSGLGQSA